MTSKQAIAATCVVGLVCIGASFLTPWIASHPGTAPVWLGEWIESALLGLGTTILLVAPIEFVASRLQQRVDDVEEATTGALRTTFEDLDTRVEGLKDLSDLSDRVDERLASERADKKELFESIATDAPTMETLSAAIEAALRSNLIDAAGVRVTAGPEISERFRFEWNTKLVVTLESADGKPIKSWAHESMDLVALFTDAARCLEPLNVWGKPDPAYALTRLSETLLFALKHPLARPTVEYIPTQWAITSTYLVAPSHAYTIRHDRTDRRWMETHVKQKPWIDHDSFDEASAIALGLFPLAEDQHKYHF